MAAPERSFPWGHWRWSAGKPSAGPSASGPGPSRSSCWQWSRWVHDSAAVLWKVQPGSTMCVASRGDKNCATWWSRREEMQSKTGEGRLWSSLSSTHMETQGVPCALCCFSLQTQENSCWMVTNRTSLSTVSMISDFKDKSWLSINSIFVSQVIYFHRLYSLWAWL